MKTLVAVLRATPAGLLLVVCLVGVEALMRTDLAFESLPVPRAYYEYSVTRKLRNLRQLRREHGSVDVLFVGSSVVRADLRPRQFDERVKKLTGRDIVSFNAGLSRMMPSGAALYIERLWLRRARPMILVHGVRESELASRQARPYYLRHGRVEPLWMKDTPRANLEAFLLSELTLLQQRGVLRRAIGRLRAGQRVHRVEKGEIISNARGYRPERRTLASARKRRSKRLWKYGGKLKANRYRYSRSAIHRIHTACEREGVQYVLLHLPEHPDRFSAKRGPAYWEDYKKRVRALAAERGIPFIDVTDGDLRAFSRDTYFADYHHMRDPGARRFTRMVADALAPLIESQSSR